MKIYCDMDDILCETAAALCKVAEAEFGVRVRYEDVRDFNLQKTFNLTDEQMRYFMETAHLEGCLEAIPETPGAVAGLKALAAAGHDVEIVTGRPATSHRPTRNWLDKAGLADFRVTYVNKYGRLFSPDEDTPEMVPLADLLKRRYDVAIDDSPVVLPALSAWKNTKVMVFNRPWNATFELFPNMRRVSGWSAILDEVGVRRT